jgi:phage terminase Nu1 subunit (DNA packaging protein)
MKIKSHIDHEPEITTSQLAQYFNLSVATINGWRNDGMPALRYNSRLFRYKLSEVKRWLEAREKRRLAQKAAEATK